MRTLHWYFLKHTIDNDHYNNDQQDDDGGVAVIFVVLVFLVVFAKRVVRRFCIHMPSHLAYEQRN